MYEGAGKNADSGYLLLMIANDKTKSASKLYKF